jgi:hypothetical protein
MKNKLKTKLKKCILYAILGDTISFINGFYKYKSTIFNESLNYSKLNIKGWSYSINIMFLWFCFVIFHWQTKHYKKKIKYYKKYSDYISSNLIHNIAFKNKKITNSYLISKYKYSDYFFKHKLVKNWVNKKKILDISNEYINRIIYKPLPKLKYDKDDFERPKNIEILENKKKIKSPSSINLLISIILGIRLYDKSFHERSKLAIKYASATHSHPYNYMSIMLLTNLISELIISNNFLHAILNVNKNIQKIKTKNKYINSFCKEFNIFIKNLTIKKNTITINQDYAVNIKNKIHTLNIAIIAINAVLIAESDWNKLIYYSGIVKNTNHSSCAIACCLYILVFGDKKAPKNQLKQIEDYDQFNTVFY